MAALGLCILTPAAFDVVTYRQSMQFCLFFTFTTSNNTPVNRRFSDRVRIRCNCEGPHYQKDPNL